MPPAIWPLTITTITTGLDWEAKPARVRRVEVEPPSSLPDGYLRVGLGVGEP